MTERSADKRIRTRCRARTKAGLECRATAIEDGLCSIHSGRVDAREIGAKGGRARGKGKRGSFRDAVRDVLARDPEKHAERLLSSGAAGYQFADRLLAEEEAKEKAERPAAVNAELRRPITYADMLEIFRGEAGQLHLLPTYPAWMVAPMIPLLAESELGVFLEHRARLDGLEEVGAPEVGEDSPSGEAAPATAVPVDEQPPPKPPLQEIVEELPHVETDADVVEVPPSPDARRSLGAIAR